MFNNFWSSWVTVAVMTLGEINYADMFLPASRSGYFKWDANLLLFLFLFLMPIVLINLLVSEDIELIEVSGSIAVVYLFNITDTHFMLVSDVSVTCHYI